MGCGGSLLQTALLKEHPTRSSRSSELMSRWGHGMCSALKWLPRRCWMRSRTPPGVQKRADVELLTQQRLVIVLSAVGLRQTLARRQARKRTGLDDINTYGQPSEQSFRRRKDEVRHAGEHTASIKPRGQPSGQPLRYKPVGLSRCGQDSRGLPLRPQPLHVWPQRLQRVCKRSAAVACSERLRRGPATWRGRNDRASGCPRACSPRRAPRAIEPCTPPQGRTSCRGPR